MKKVSIVIPTYNERRNVNELTHNIAEIMRRAGVQYELLFIDDHSTDGTIEYLESIKRYFPIQTYLKEGKKGKAFSLLQGFQRANHDIVVMIDADLQYPPEGIPQMVNKLDEGFDVIVANRVNHRTSLLRKLFSKTFSFIFAKLLHKFDCDVQSGLKVFKKEIIERVQVKPSEWTFDLEFLLNARNAGYQIGTIDISFKERKSGKSKVNLLKASYEIGLNALKLKFKPAQIIPFHPKVAEVKGDGFHYQGAEFVNHTSLPHTESAFYRLSASQKLAFLLVAALLVCLFTQNWMLSLIFIFSFMTMAYFADLLFNLFLVYRGFYKSPEIKIKKGLMEDTRNEWPLYTILCPLYKESKVLPQFIKAISNIDYPKNKLEVMLLLEEDDQETISAAQSMKLPEYFKIKIVPHSQPKTKPKACNYGLRVANGEYVVIYDAEDMPEPDQLKKAVLAFEQESNDVVCIQAKLSYYNWPQNLLTRLFTLEYSFWFDLILAGLHSIQAPIPLGGTSNHFKTQALKEINGWDSFNVTEDADLGLRLFKKGYRTAIMDSTTYEEANSRVRNWFRQRSRWIKGYMQTYLVHMRRPQDFYRHKLDPHLITFQLIIGMKIVTLLINPLLWVMTISYFAFRPAVGGFIESLFLPPIFYIGTFTLFLGNFLYMYFYAIGVAKRGLWNLVIYAPLVPVYWLLMSAAATLSLWELLVKPHYWQKTHHGLHLNKPVSKKMDIGSISYSLEGAYGKII